MGIKRRISFFLMMVLFLTSIQIPSFADELDHVEVKEEVEGTEDGKKDQAVEDEKEIEDGKKDQEIEDEKEIEDGKKDQAVEDEDLDEDPVKKRSEDLDQNPKIIYVDSSGDDEGDGKSWESAFKTLEKAVEVLNDGDQIWLAEGEYKLENNGEFEGISIGNNVEIYGGFSKGDQAVDERSGQRSKLEGTLEFADYDPEVGPPWQQDIREITVLVDGLDIENTECGIAAFNVDLTVKNVNIENVGRHMEVNGGSDKGSLVIEDSNFSGSEGGMSASGMDITIKDTSYLDNQAGIYLMGFIDELEEFSGRVDIGNLRYEGNIDGLHITEFKEVSIGKSVFQDNYQYCEEYDGYCGDTVLDVLGEDIVLREVDFIDNLTNRIDIFGKLDLEGVKIENDLDFTEMLGLSLSFFGQGEVEENLACGSKIEGLEIINKGTIEHVENFLSVEGQCILLKDIEIKNDGRVNNGYEPAIDIYNCGLAMDNISLENVGGIGLFDLVKYHDQGKYEEELNFKDIKIVDKQFTCEKPTLDIGISYGMDVELAGYLPSKINMENIVIRDSSLKNISETILVRNMVEDKLDLDIRQLNVYDTNNCCILMLEGNIEADIVNSTIVNNRLNQYFSGCEPCEEGERHNEIRVKNSLMYANDVLEDGECPFNEFDDNSNVSYEYSLLEGSGGSDNWKDFNGEDKGNNIDQDPLLKNRRGELNLGSPAIGGGADGDYWDYDLLGNPREVGQIDMGAFEAGGVEYQVSYLEDGTGKELIPLDRFMGVHGKEGEARAKYIAGYSLVNKDEPVKKIILRVDGENTIEFKYKKVEEGKEYPEKPEVPEGPGGGVIVPPVRPEKPEKPETPKDPEGPEDPETPELNREVHFAYLEGYPDGSIRPEEDISREAVAAVFFRLLDEDYREEIRSEKNSFKDIAKTRWSNKHISTLAQGDILKGYEDGSFRPGKSITRGELASIIKRFSKEEGDGKVDFKDIGGHWAEEAIKEAASQGWIEGYEDGSFRPDKYISRAELTTLVNRVLEREPKLENILKDRKEFKDLKEDKWYYLPMIEAANGHDYDMVDGEEVWTELRDFDQEM